MQRLDPVLVPVPDTIFCNGLISFFESIDIIFEYPTFLFLDAWLKLKY
jgi:hypothetical protein